jgi:hypothetical protein
MPTKTPGNIGILAIVDFVYGRAREPLIAIADMSACYDILRFAFCLG